ncbi:uncharacterized protein V6R79_022165 [Siganus canaliculatus]
MIDDIVFNTDLYAVRKGNENLGLTSEEFKTFLGINMVMSYIKYSKARMYWSSEQGLCLDLVKKKEKLKTEKQLKKEGRGSVSVVTSAQNITITRWMDSSIIHMASSCSVVNAWFLYRMSGNEAKDLLHFKASTACALINAASETIRSRGRPSATPPPVKRRAVVKVPPEVR